jgi:hypothetical protein
LLLLLTRQYSKWINEARRRFSGTELTSRELQLVGVTG